MSYLTPKELGKLGEEAAERHLTQMGYLIHARNWRWAKGELDIVAEQHDEIVFVEVKTRRSQAFGIPEESITRSKRDKLMKTALAYLQDKSLVGRQWRIDVVAIEADENGEVLRMEHIVSAIEG